MILMVDGAGVTHNMNDGSVAFRPALSHDSEPKHQGPDAETLKWSAVIIVIHYFHLSLMEKTSAIRKDWQESATGHEPCPSSTLTNWKMQYADK